MLKTKNKQFYVLVIFFLISFSSFCQVIQTTDKEFSIEILAARKLKKIQLSTLKILQSDKLKTVFIKIDMSSVDKNKKEFDVNKFILLDTVNKLKIRAMDISYQNFSAYTNFGILTKKNHSFNPKHSILTYDPSITDSFESYNFEDFYSLEIPINYGSNKKPELHIIYYKPKKFKSKKIVFFFPFPKEENNGVLYYGNQKIATLNFE
ncbi:hypothetical protein [Flavobacterium flavipallidum]|uniref:Uncharacterized protein n=1 Tax=Flavobacterium flavipallidum TaxID=3139140 RepID=A0ABU9HQK8_9FLAO